MMRFPLRRVCAAIVFLVLGLLVVGVDTASATHFRSGTVRWEKVTTHNVPGEYKFRVTFETGWRWSFPFGGIANQCTTPAVIAQGFIATAGTQGSGSCLPVGSTAALGSITSNKAVRFNASSSPTTALTYNSVITRVLPEYDQMFSTFTFDVTFPATSSPVTLVYNSSARISTLLEGNADQIYQLVAVLNGDPAFGTRSPRSVSLPVIPITAGIVNQFQLPNIAYDGFTNKYRFSTTAESGLVRAVPGSSTATTADDMTISDTGIVTFTPPAVAGPYAVQFMVGAYDANGVKRHEIPVDLTMHAYAPAVGAPTVVLTGPSTVAFQAGNPVSFQLQAVLSPPAAGWAGNILSTPVPSAPTGVGAAMFNVTPGNVSVPTLGTFNWTPTVDNTSDAMCFQAIYRNTSSGAVIVSPGQKCVSLTQGALATALSAVSVSPAGPFVGQRPTVTTVLTRTVDGAPQPQRTVRFTVSEPTGATRTYSALTGPSGNASASVLVPSVGPYSVVASFDGVDDALLPSTSAAGVFTASPATGATFIGSPAASNGPSLQLASPLTIRMNVQPANLPSPPGQLVEFAINGPSGAQSVFGVTDNDGYATTSDWVPALPGVYQVFARFNGSPDVTGTAQSATASLTVRQRIELQLTLANTVAGAPATLEALLQAIPQGTPIARTVALSWTGTGAPNLASLTTNAQGVAVVTGLAFANAGTFTLTGTVIPTAGELNSLGVIANEIEAIGIVVAKAATTMPITAPSVVLNNNPVTASVTLSRTSAPAGPAVSQTVAFVLTNQSGVTMTTLNTTTNASGVATVTFPASNFAASGFYNIVATYAGTTVLESAQSTAPVAVSNLPLPTLTLGPIAAFAGSPTTATATLMTDAGAPIPGRSVTLELPTGTQVAAATTNALGVATFTFTVSNIGQFTATARFAGTAGQHGPAVATAPATVSKVPAALSAPLFTPATPQVGQSITAGTTLTLNSGLTATPAGRLIVFTMTSPAGDVQQPVVNTVAGGGASTTLTTLARGAYSLRANYPGSTTEDAATSPTTTINVYQPTTLTTSPVSGMAGVPVSVSATLRTLTTNLPIAGQTVTFTFGASGAPALTAVTNASGVATVMATIPVSGNTTIGASFLNTADFYANNTGSLAATTASATATMAPATTSLAAIAVPPTGNVGESITLSTTLTRAGGATVAGAPVSFVVNGSGTTNLTATTDASGVATVSFPLTARGSHSVSAFFDGTGGYVASSVGPVSFTVLQRSQLTASPATGVAGANATVSATLLTFPAGTPVAGQVVTFDFGGVIASQSATTDASGVATVTGVFSSAGTFNFDAAFSNAAAYFVAAAASETLTVAPATTTLAPLSVTSNALTGNILTVATELQRTTAPAGAVPNAIVTFTLTNPNSSIQTVTSTTNALGQASASFPALFAKGNYSVSAQFIGTSTLSGSTSNTASIAVYQRTQLTVAPAAGYANQPVQLVASLTELPSGMPLAGQVITFDADNGTAQAVTGANGIATVSMTRPVPGTFGLTATFANGAAFFTNAAGSLPAQPEIATSTLTLSAVPTQMTVTTAATSLVGDTLTAEATLASLAAPMAGQTITFTMIGDGTPVTSTAVTNISGSASASFSPNARGVHTITATFAGDAALLASSVSTPNINVYQRTQLTLAPVSGSAGAGIPLSATLTAVPSGTPVAGQTVQFIAPGFTGSGLTDASGAVSVSATFAAAGSLSVSASFDNLADFYVNQSGQLLPSAATSTITVTDPTPPVVTYSVTGTLGSDGWYVGDVDVTWSVSDPESTVSAQTGCGPVTVWADGTVAFTCEATSDGGTTTRSVTVKLDKTAPEITTPGLQIIEATSPAGAEAAYPAATATDATSGLAQLNCVPAVGTIVALGDTTVTCTATDVAGNASTSPFTVRVVDTTAPSIDPVSDVSVSATSPLGAIVTYTPPSTNDIVDGAATAVCVPASGSQFSLGLSVVTCTATDSRGNTRASGFNVNVTNTPPTLTAPAGPISLPATSASGAIATFVVTASDDEDTAIAATCVPASGTTFAIGTTQVTCSVTDVAGASASATFDVVVTNNAPTFTAPASISVPATSGAGATVTFTANGQDLEDGPIAAVCTPASGTTFAIGTTTVSCTVTDVAGATASGSFNVTVTNQAPVVTVPANITQPATGATGAIAIFTSSATDLEDGALTPTCVPASGSTFGIGTATVSCSATDVAGATDTKTFTVTVTNNSPVVTVPSTITRAATSGAGAAVTFAPTAIDVEDGVLIPSCVPASGSTFAIGNTSVNCSAVDSRGATNVKSFLVTVTNAAPTFAAPANITTVATSATNAIVTYTAAGNDLEQGGIPAVCAPASGSAFPIGTTTVSCSVTDFAGLTALGSFTVTVKAANTAAFLIRRAPVVNGGTTVQGSLRMMTAENMTFNGGTVTGDLLIPGTPQLTRNGQTTLGGIVDGSGSATPTNHRITMNGSTSLSRIVRRTDGFAFSTVAAPANPAGTRSVSLNNANDAIGSWSTLKDLTLNGNIGSVSVPGGTYGSFTANGSNKLVLGVAGSTTPTVYNFQSVVLNGTSSIEVVGPVIVTVKNALSLNGSIGSTNNPQWLTLRIANGGLTMNGNIAVRGFVEAPSGNVTVNGNSVLTGRIIADSLTLNGSAKLILVP